MENKYGYKVCYKKHGSEKLKIFLITNSYDLANWHVRWYQKKPPLDRKTLKPIEMVTWIIQPIKTFLEYKLRWKGCPF